MNRQSDSLNFIAELVNVDADAVKDEVIAMLQNGAESAKKSIVQKHEADIKGVVYGPYIREIESCVNKRPVKEKGYTYPRQGTLIGDDTDDTDDTDDEYLEYNDGDYEVYGQWDLQEQLKLYTDLEIRERIEDLADEEANIYFY